MKLNIEQTKALLQMIATAKPDSFDCDGCYEHLADLIDRELLDSEVPETLEKVKRHLDQCPCCGDERNALLEALANT